MKRICMLLLILLACSGCGTYQNDGDAGYVPNGETVFPNIHTSEKGSVPYAVAKLIAAGQVVRDYGVLHNGELTAKESYFIRTFGVSVELYRGAEQSLVAWAKEQDAYPIVCQNDKIYVFRDDLVMLIPTQKNADGQDVSDKMQKLIQRFLSIEIS